MNRPPPLVPPEVDLRGYEFMPLFGDRLFGSTTYIEASIEGKVAMPRIWWRAYAKEVPAASLPDNDQLLADYAGYGVSLKGWKKIRAQVMRGFVLCSDGRWYHPFVAELALKAWKSRLADRLRTLKARIAATQKRLREAVTDHDRAHISALLQEQEHELSQLIAWSVTDDPKPCHRVREERIGDERIGDSGSNTSAASNTSPTAAAPPSPRQPAELPDTPELRDARLRSEMSICLRSQGVTGSTPSHPLIVGWQQGGVTVDLLREAIVIARDRKPNPQPIPISYLEGIVVDLRQAPRTLPINGKPWFVDSWSTITAKGTELGLTQEPDETDPEYRSRVFEAAGITEDDVRKAEADYRR